MTTREAFAMAAMQGLMANPGGPVQANGMNGWDYVNCKPELVAEIAVKQADALLDALTRPHIVTQPTDLAAREARANDRWLDYCRDHDKHPDDDAGCQAWQEIFSEEGVV